MTATALLLSNCSNEETMPKNDTLNTIELFASINEPDSRAAVTDEGVFSWTAGDQLDVHTSGNPAWQTFTLQGNGGLSSGTFQGATMAGATPTSCALHPASLGHVLSENKLTLTLPSEYEFKEGVTNVLMLAPVIEGKSNLAFKHLGGLFRFVIKNIPATASQFVFTATGKKLTGEFVIDDITPASGLPEITTSESGSENSVTIHFTASADIKERRFYIPVPTGSYGALKCEIKDGQGTLLTTTNVADTKEVSRAALMLVPEITCTTIDGGIAVNAATEEALTKALSGAVTAEADQDVPKATTITVDEALSSALPETIAVPVANMTSSVAPVVTIAFGDIPKASNGTGGGNSIKITDGTTETSTAPSTTSKATIEVAIPQVQEGETAPSAELFMPTSTGVLAATTKTAAYGDITATTADNTLIVNKGVTVNSLTIKGGSVKIFGTVTTLTIDSNSNTTKVLVYPGGSCSTFTDNRQEGKITLSYVPGDPGENEGYTGGDKINEWD